MIPASESAALAQRTTPIYLEGRLPVIEANTARQLGLQDGQVIQANVETQHSQWLLRFQSGGSLPVPKDWPNMMRLSAGDNLYFRVQWMANGSIVLRPVNTLSPSASTPNATLFESTQMATPVTDPLTQLLARPSDGQALRALLQPGALEDLARQIGGVPGLLAEWLKLRPSMQLMHADQLRLWLTQSGWFNEALMQQGKSPTGVDLKTALRSLLKAMQQAQDAGTEEVQSALDDLESSQLATVMASHHGEPAPAVMLAFRDAPPVKMQIRRQPAQEDGSQSLLVDLELKNPDLGNMWLRTRILDSSNLEMVMWAEREDVVQMARQHADRLQHELQLAGLTMLSLQVFHGQAPNIQNIEPVDRDPGQLLDVRT